MSRLIVTAEASPLFGNFLMCVSVSTESDGKPVQSLKPKNFKIYHLASLNHAHANPREVTKVEEGPDGCYIVQLLPKDYQPYLPPGHYVFAVAVETYTQSKEKSAGKKGGGIPTTPKDHGQTIAVGDLPTYGQWQ
jgi:hypothetical protein